MRRDEREGTPPEADEHGSGEERANRTGSEGGAAADGAPTESGEMDASRERPRTRPDLGAEANELLGGQERPRLGGDPGNPLV
jgi:hypothetical protein